MSEPFPKGFARRVSVLMVVLVAATAVLAVRDPVGALVMFALPFGSLFGLAAVVYLLGRVGAPAAGAEPLLEEADKARREGRLDDAVAASQRCTEQGKAGVQARALLELGICQAKLGHGEDAAQSFARLSGHRGTGSQRLESVAAGWAALLHALEGRSEEAGEALQRARRRPGVEDDFWRFSRAVLYSRQGDHKSAFASLGSCWGQLGRNLPEGGS